MERDVVYVFGHRHPDTDSICSSIAYADLKNKLGIKAQAVRLGEINKETAFVLDFFNTPVPPLLENVKTQVCDLKIDKAEKLSPETTIKKAWSIMENAEVKTLPVVDDDEKLLGIVSLSDITHKYMDVFNFNAITSCGTTLDNIIETIAGDIIVGEPDWFKAAGKVVVAAGQPEKMGEYAESGDIIIVGDRTNVQRAAIELGVGAIITTCSHVPNGEIIRLATEKKILFIMTSLDTYTTVRLINQAIPVGSIMCRDDENTKIVKFRETDYLENIKEKMTKNRYRSYPVLDENDRVCGFISRFHLISQHKKHVILVDHNERAQTCPGIEEAEVMEIIDHHKVGDLTTTAPILFKNEPVGSTATIIANMYSDLGRRPAPSVAGILCAAIISDTLKFQSPTSTEIDKKTAEKLATISGVNIEDLAAKMFTAGSEFKGKTAKEIYSQDFKRVSFNDYHCGVSQITILNMDYIRDEKDAVIEYMNNAAETDKFDLLALMITELSSRTTELWLTGTLSGAVKKELSVQSDKNVIRFTRLMSRKKDIIPMIDSAIEKINL